MNDNTSILFLQKDDFSQAEWQDWQWQMRNRIRTINDLKKWMAVSQEEAKAIEQCEGIYKWTITPYYASLMDKLNTACPIRKQAIPASEEFIHDTYSSIDPVGDKSYLVTNRVVHKYQGKVIILVTELCPVYCRHCTRKYHTTSVEGTYFAESEKKSWELDFQYLREHPEIRDVLLTGGDPLTYSDERIDYILTQLRLIKHIEIIRIGTRFPVLLPFRITENLCKILEKHHPVWVNTHFNHEREITEEAAKACSLLLQHGIPVGNQTVLLKGINDSLVAIKGLCEKLLKIRVRPYYLYHCDNVKGVSHFRTSISTGQEIVRNMLGNTTGFAIPQYVITTLDGKIPLNDNYLVEVSEGDQIIKLRNRHGEIIILEGGVKRTIE